MNRIILWSVLAISSATMVARAQAAPKPAKMTVFILPEGELSPKVAAKLAHGFVRALRPNTRLDVKDPDKLLVEYAGEVPSAAIASATDLYKKGEKLLNARRTAEAVEALEKSIEELEPTLAFIQKNALADACMLLGVAYATAGNRAAAVKAFKDLLVWRPQLTYSTDKLPARYLPLFLKAQEAVKEVPKGSIELTTEPPGAKAYIDGRFVGITPSVAFGLRAGTHYATYKMEGYVKAAQKVLVSPKMQKKYKQELGRSDKFLLLKQVLDTVKNELGAPEATTAMNDLRSFLFIDQVVFARVRRVDADSLLLQTFLYDLRSKQRLNQATRTVKDKKPGPEIEEVARLLYTKVRYDGTMEAPPEPAPPPPPKRTPFYATWWFWTAVGVGVAGIVIPIVVWPDTKTCADNYRCITVSN